MELETKAWLYDILNAIHEIESFLIDTTSFSLYENDIKTKRAVERNLEIIGEAVSRLITHTSIIILSNSRQIVDTRNRIIHGYDSVSGEIIWGIVHTHLPILKQEVETLLNE